MAALALLLHSFGDIYPFGQCTYWAAHEEPWVQRYGNLGNAYQWAANWRRHGGVVTLEPVVGDVACFQPGVDEAEALGHVAVVIGVGDGVFTVSEMNGPKGPGVVDDRVCKLVPGVAFLAQSAPPPPFPQPAPEELDVLHFVVNPGDPRRPVAGFTGDNTVNLVAYATTSAVVFGYDPKGGVIASPTIVLDGNDPNVAGPKQAGGFIRNVLGRPDFVGPLTLVFYPASEPYSVSLY